MSPSTFIVQWSLKRPWLIVAAFLWLVPIGYFALHDSRVEFTPNLAPTLFSIDTQAPGLVAEQVEQTVTRPIEAAVLGAPGIEQVRSRSLQGLSVVTGEFAPGADHDRVRQALEERLAGVRGLPSGVDSPVMEPLAAPDGDLIKIAFSSDKLDSMGLRDLVQWTVRPRLLAVRGVAQVRLYGGQVRRLEVRARPGDLSDSDLGFLDIIAAVRRATGVAGAGFIDTPNQRVLIEPYGQALTADEVGAGQIQTAGSAPVRIADVADVVEAATPQISDAALQGKPVVMLVLERQVQANTIETTHATEQVLSELKPLLVSQGVTVRADIDRPASFTVRAMQGLSWDLVIGFGLVAILLAVLIREPRSLIITLITIPTTFLVSLIVLRSFGWSLNTMTLGGLVVALGLVIDDAVIDIEDISARLRDAEAHNRSFAEAVLAASIEIRAPLVFGTLGMALALAPLLWMGGAAGTLLAPLAAAIIVASLASLAVALTLTPALAVLLLGKRAAHAAPRFVHRLGRRLFHGLPALASRPLMAVVVALVFAAATALLFMSFHGEFLPGVHDNHLFVQLRSAAGVSPQAADDLDSRIGADLRAQDGVISVAETIGRSAFGGDTAGLDQARFDLELAPKLSASAQDALAQRIRNRLDALPGLEAQVSSRFDASQVFRGAGAPVQLLLFGREFADLDAAAPKAKALLAAQPASGGVDAPATRFLPTVRADINFDRLAIFGLSTADVLDTVQAAFAGETMAEIYQGDRTEDLAITAQANLRRDPDAVGDLLLRSTSGISVPLKSIAKVYLTSSRAEILHEAGQRVEMVEADAKPGLIDRLAHQTRAGLATLSLPAGVYAQMRSVNSTETLWRPLRLAYAIGGFLLAAFLAVAFDVRTAALAMAAAAYSALGAAIAIAAMGGVVSVGVSAGLVAGFGFSLRSAILLISRVEDRVIEHGATWSLAVVAQTTRERAGPILMATMLLILALAPLALSLNSPGHEILSPMAVVIIAGVLTGAVADLTLLPIMTWAFWRPPLTPSAPPTGE